MILRESKEEQVLEYAKETEKAGEQMLALIEKAIYEAEKATGEEISAHSDKPKWQKSRCDSRYRQNKTNKRLNR